jgi:hypothetical protein
MKVEETFAKPSSPAIFTTEKDRKRYIDSLNRTASFIAAGDNYDYHVAAQMLTEMHLEHHNRVGVKIDFLKELVKQLGDEYPVLALSVRALYEPEEIESDDH